MIGSKRWSGSEHTALLLRSPKKITTGGVAYNGAEPKVIGLGGLAVENLSGIRTDD